MTSRRVPFLVLALVAATTGGCRKAAPPEAIPIRAAESATKNVTTPPEAWARLGSFAISGRLGRLHDGHLRIEEVNPAVGWKDVTALSVVDLSGAVVSRNAIVPGEVAAASFDGSVQLVLTPKGTVDRIEVPSMKKSPWKGPDPTSGQLGGLALSDDLRLVGGSRGNAYVVEELATGKVVCNVGQPFAGGGEPDLQFMREGRFFVLASRVIVVVDVASCTKQYARGFAFDVSADGRVLVDFPSMSFAQSWSETFVVRDGKTGDELRTLSLKIPTAPGAIAGAPYAASLTPKGDRVVVVRDRMLHLLRTSDGAEVSVERVDDLVPADPDVRVEVLTTDDEVVLGVAGRATRLRLPAAAG